MNLCSSRHDEICYESRNCPMCEMMENHKDEIEVLEDKISELNNEISDLAGQL